MTEEEEKVIFTVEGGFLGIKEGGEFTPLANFFFKITHFVGGHDIGMHFLSLIYEN